MKKKGLDSENIFAKHRFTGIVLISASILFSLIGLFIAFVAFASLSGVNIPMPIGGFTIAGLSFFLSSVSYQYGRRLSVRDAQELMSKDTRPPVIYLRSFKDDEQTAKEVHGYQSFFYLPFFVKTEEEILAHVLSKIGPCIALNRPGETLPKLGMARMNVNGQGQDWHSEVTDLLKRAGAVVIRVDYTKNLGWEIQTTMTCVKPERLLFLLPFEPDQGRSNLLGLAENRLTSYEIFRQMIEKKMPCRLPPFSSQEMMYCSFTGVLFFEPDWTPHIIGLAGMGRNRSPRFLLKKSLKPFLARFNNENSSPEVS